MALGAKISNGQGQYMSRKPDTFKLFPSVPCFSVLASVFHQNGKEAYVYWKYITAV